MTGRAVSAATRQDAPLTARILETRLRVSDFKRGLFRRVGMTMRLPGYSEIHEREARNGHLRRAEQWHSAMASRIPVCKFWQSQ
jgi:hypothetical protein